MGEFRRNMQDLVNNPRGYLEMIADRLQNASKGRRAVINDQGAGYRNLTQQERLQAVQQAAMDNLGGGGLGIIKAKGGNWLTGSVENALKGLKKRYASAVDLPGVLEEARAFGIPGDVEREIAAAKTGPVINNWIEGPLTKYVKRDMATEGDPVRKLAEQGILHSNDVELWGRNFVHPSGEHYEKLAKNPMAQAWENASDNMLRSEPASTYQNFGSSNLGEEWVNKLDPDTPFYLPKDNTVGVNLGFSHLTDELANALNPESGLPRHLQLTPEQMQQMGMEKAVRHVDAINKWRAAQKAEANAKLAQSPAVRMMREYAENNPKGLRWVELKQPDLPEGMTLRKDPFGVEEIVDQTGKVVTDAGTLKDPRIQALREQLKYEGDTMGHCVGGYCDNVASGKSRIFSLRDAKGEPHVTIETRPDGETQSIVQIKGKQNLKPKDEYLPFVQDFVRNHPEGGKWGDIGDLNNAGLYRHHVSKYPESVKDLGEYASKEDIENWVANNVKPTPGFAQGGSVQGNTTWRPMELDGIIGYITE